MAGHSATSTSPAPNRISGSPARPLDPLDPTWQLASGPECGTDIELGLPVHRLETESPHHRRHGHHELSHGQVLADAAPRAASEGQVGVAGGLARSLGVIDMAGEAGRVEALGVLPDIRVVVNSPHAHGHDATGRYLMARQAGARMGVTDDGVARGVVPEGLVDDMGRVHELIDVGVADRLVSGDGGHLVANALLLRLMAAEQVQGEGQCGAGGLMPGDEESQGLVPHGHVVEGLPGLGIAGREQQAEQIAGRG